MMKSYLFYILYPGIIVPRDKLFFSVIFCQGLSMSGAAKYFGVVISEFVMTIVVTLVSDMLQLLAYSSLFMLLFIYITWWLSVKARGVSLSNNGFPNEQILEYIVLERKRN